MSSKLLCLICTIALMVASSLNASAEDQSLTATQSTQRYTFVESGKLSKDVELPVYEWYPTKSIPDGMILAVHGLTLHGQSYEILARAFAAENALGSYYVVAPDIRGFGRNRTSHDFCNGKDCKAKVNYGKTVDDIAHIASRMKEKYPGVPLYLLGESLGATICLATAASHPELINGLVLSGTAVNKNGSMFTDPSNILAAAQALFDAKHRVRLHVFINKLVSDDPEIVKEFQDDPLVPKELTIKELLQTSRFTGKTVSFAKKVAPSTPILILQGSDDKCVVPGAVVKLAAHLRTSDQTMRWLYAHSHLLLETAYIRPATIDAMTNWFPAHTSKHEQVLESMRKDLRALGGKAVDQPTRPAL